uniref:NADH dehydrogenase [ubiquinone] 1 beta subcomplex subunit 1 n=2 Tax=Sus scrofa TaxID=9823 RepID=A0A8D1TMZ0_PIG
RMNNTKEGHRLLHDVCNHWVHILALMGFVLGCYLDKKNYEKLTLKCSEGKVIAELQLPSSPPAPLHP